MRSLTTLAEACTAPRASLLALIGVISMAALLLGAEMPLNADLQVAVAQQKFDTAERLPAACEPALLKQVTGPLSSFDGRPQGYSEQEALQILCAMGANGEAGKRSYLDLHFPLDMVFAASYGLAFAALLLFLAQAWGWQRSAVTYVALIPFAAGLLDLSENLTVRRIVTGSLPPDPGLVQIASAITRVKYGFVSVSLVLVLIGLLWYLLRNSFRSARQQASASS